MRARSVLFGPAARVDFVPKFVASGADIGVLDLEDATPEGRKAAARDTLRDAVPGSGELGDMKLFVRTNAPGSAHFVDDLAAAAASRCQGIIVPKLESNREVTAVREAMAAADIGDHMLCGGIESVAGVHRAVEICGAGVDLVYFGAEDFITDMGGVRTESNTEVLYARSRVAMAARLALVWALDQVVVDYGDSARFEREAGVARSLGYDGKVCIHPSQVAIANAAFTPSEAEVERARALVAAADAGEAAGDGVVSFEGTMVDAPIINRARALIAAAGNSS